MWNKCQCRLRTFLVGTINVDGYAYVAERFFAFRYVFTLEARCTQQADPLKVFRDKALFTLRFAHPRLAVTIDKLGVTVLVRSRGCRTDTVRLHETGRTTPACDFLLFPGLTDASLPGTAAAFQLSVPRRVILADKIGKAAVTLTKLTLPVPDQQLERLSDVVEQADQKLVGVLLLISLEYRIHLSAIRRAKREHDRSR